MAYTLGDMEAAALYGEIFTRGSQYLNVELFNGEYYYQKIDLEDQKLLEEFHAVDPYWDEESGQIKYQIGEGCILDQVLAQWHATLYGLGGVLGSEKVEAALRSIYQYNFKAPMRKFPNPCRLFSLNDEAGLVICDYPSGRKKPRLPIPYAQETMTGFEYAAASQMIMVGLVDEGMRVVEAVRDRYDGEKRNPWNEIECGSNYARSMASYALLNAFSGFQFDMTCGWIGFSPVNLPENLDEPWSCFWSLDSGWGTVRVEKDCVRLTVLGGCLRLNFFHLPFLTKKVKAVYLGDRKICYHLQHQGIAFDECCILLPEMPLVVVTG